MKTLRSFFHKSSTLALFLVVPSIVADVAILQQKQSRRMARKKKKESQQPTFSPEERATIIDLPVTCKTFDLQLNNLSQEDQLLCTFLDKISFTQQGVKTFFEQTFNQKEYGKTFLPHNFSHIEQFLYYGQESQQGLVFYEGVMRLFIQKLKSALYIDSETYAHFMEDNKQLFVSLFPHETSGWQNVKKILWDNFCKNFSFFKSDPSSFLDTVSQEIEQHISLTNTTPERLRNTLFRLFSTTIDKLAWVVDDQYATWLTFRSIGDSIAFLHENKVITSQQDCNELYWGLIERYCYFLELNGGALKPESCFAMKQDLLTGKLPWLVTKESEDYITTKAERIAQALLETEARSMAYKQEGLLTDFLPIKSIR